LPITDAVCDSLLTMPISAGMTDDEARYCADQLAEALNGPEFPAPEQLHS
jgi:dTDP-4-amino-4,6-dideoxygalactose transaminase